MYIEFITVKNFALWQKSICVDNFLTSSRNRTVKLPSSDEVRLVDDAFIKICHMVNDLSMTVRREAAGLLGSLHLVSQKFLEQTLDKKLMSHLKASHSDQ